MIFTLIRDEPFLFVYILNFGWRDMSHSEVQTQDEGLERARKMAEEEEGITRQEHAVGLHGVIHPGHN